MLITISNKDNVNFSFEGTISDSTIIHNANEQRTLAGVGYQFNNGKYKVIRVSISEINKSDKERLEHIILNGAVNITTEVGEDYINVVCTNQNIDYNNENEDKISTSLEFKTNILNYKN